MGRVGPLELLLLALILALPVLLVVAVIGVLVNRGRQRGAHPTAPAAPGREQVIERQVLVQRCRFCQKLTPVDLSACAECGARS